MSEIRKIDVELDRRVETGPVQFNDDWPGVFIRGDNAAYYAIAIENALLYGLDGVLFTKTHLEKLAKILRSSRV